MRTDGLRSTYEHQVYNLWKWTDTLIKRGNAKREYEKTAI